MTEAATELEKKRNAITNQVLTMSTSPKLEKLIRTTRAELDVENARVAAAESELAAIESQTGILERDRRDEAERERQEKLAADRLEISEVAQSFLESVKGIEKATRETKESIDKTLALYAHLIRLMQGQTPDGKVPLAMNPIELVTRLSGRFVGIMSGVKGHLAHFGALKWVGGSLYPASQVWYAEEAKRLDPTLKELNCKIVRRRAENAAN